MLITESIDSIPPSKVKGFSCGNLDLDEYLKRFSKKNDKNDIAKTFVYIDSDTVIGFYSISMSSIAFHDLPEKYKGGLPKYPIPVALIGKLAVDSKFQGREIGSALLIDAFQRILDASTSIAAFAVIVDAKNEKAKKFYQNFEFENYKQNPFSLFLPMKTVVQLLQSTRPKSVR